MTPKQLTEELEDACSDWMELVPKAIQMLKNIDLVNSKNFDLSNEEIIRCANGKCLWNNKQSTIVNTFTNEQLIEFARELLEKGEKKWKYMNSIKD